MDVSSDEHLLSLQALLLRNVLVAFEGCKVLFWHTIAVMGEVALSFGIFAVILFTVEIECDPRFFAILVSSLTLCVSEITLARKQKQVFVFIIIMPS